MQRQLADPHGPREIQGMNKDAKIFVAGHRGLVGQALCRTLKSRGFENLVVVSREEVDLTDPVAVKWFFSSTQPEYVFLSAAKVGGIVANSERPVDFMVDNLRIEMNVLENSWKYGVKKLLFLGSACAYPKHAENPIREESLLTGALEPSNECYALAKIAGIKLCQAYRKQHGCDFISAMPTNLYGISDHYDLQNSHVIPGMIHRIHDAKAAGKESVTLWGTGQVTREFLFADDLAAACVLLMDTVPDLGLVNIAPGGTVSLETLAEMVARVVGFAGRMEWDVSKPDGTPLRALDSSKIYTLGWMPRVSLADGLELAYQDFLCQQL